MDLDAEGVVGEAPVAGLDLAAARDAGVADGVGDVHSRPDLSAAIWRKSSYSNSDGGDCVEVADGFPGVMPVRGSKDPDGPALVFPAAAWSAFVSAVKAGHFPA